MNAVTLRWRQLPSYTFAAPILGLAVTIGVLGLLNAPLIAAYGTHWLKSPVTADAPAAAPMGTTSAPKPSNVPKTPLLTIPGLGVKAPVVFGMSSTDEADVQAALERGVLHFGGSALPGQAGNAVFVGHSSGQLWTPGDYKFVFSGLSRLEPGAIVTIAHDGRLYEYIVTGKTIVNPNDVSVLAPTQTATATFITCWPLGVNSQRLVVKAALKDPEPQKRAGSLPLEINNIPQL